MLSVGEILRKERENRGLTLQQIEKAIRIREKFLRALEESDWEVFPSKIYITGILKNYARYLNLDDKKLSAFFRREYARKEEIKFKKKLPNNYLAAETKRFTFLGIFIIFFLFCVYFGYQLALYLSPPKLSIVAPEATTFYNTDKITVIGKTEKEASVSIFGDRVYIDKDGKFEYDFPLKKGKNKLVIEVIGGNGKKTELVKEYERK